MVELAFQPEDGTVVIHVWPYDDVPEREERVPLSRLLEAAHWSEVVLTPEGQPLPEGNRLSYLEDLTLDRQGTGDDNLVARTIRPDGEDRGSTELEVTLGTGEVLSWSYPDVTNPTVSPLHMTSGERQSLLASLVNPGSNYGACAYVVLEVENGELAERFHLDAIMSAYTQTGENGLDTLRIPELYDKWHSYLWGTAAWDGRQITFISDGYFTDTYVGELIGMDYQTVEPTRLASVGPYNYAVMYHLLEAGILTAFPEADAMLRDAPMPLAAQSAAVAYFYSNRPADMTVFFADQAPLQPEGRTMRIDEASYLGLRQLYETYGVVYQLRCSGWEDGGWYAYPEPLWLVFQLGQGGDMTTVLGESVPRKTVEQAALEQGYHLVDGEIALWRDGYPNPAGPGSEVGFFQEEPVVTVLEGAEPIYQAGDWWQQMEWEGLSALCYCNADGSYAIQRLETTRTDLSTGRGIRVGSTRAEVEAAYGEELSHTDYWGLYSGEDCLWYCADPAGWGAAILFFFDGDQVSRIVLNNMFN